MQTMSGDARVRRLEDRRGGGHRRHVDHRGVGAGRPHRLGHGVEDRHLALERLPALARRHARHDAGAVLEHLARVERAVAAGDALHHAAGCSASTKMLMPPPAPAGPPARTASSMSLSARMPTPSRMRIASTSLVPVSRMTIGTFDLELAGGGDDAVGHVVGPGDAAEDVEEDRLHVRVGGDDLERVDDLLRARAAADVEEVGRLAAVVLHQVHRGHREPGAVHHAAHVAVELDEREVGPARRRLARLLGRVVAQHAEVGPPEELVVVDDDLGVEREHPRRRAW